jgi:tetratricopeptide (TPR) repeat protein
MASRLLSRLDSNIASTRDESAADSWIAEKASHYFRTGATEEGRSLLQALQAKYSAKPDPRVSAWVHFATGLEVYFSDMGSGALDKLQRAHAVSKACGIVDAQARTAAWIAHVHYGRHQFDRTLDYLNEALQVVSVDDHSTLSRVCLVAADSLHLADHYALAESWYARTRHHAAIDGDEVTPSAVLFNSASLRAVNIRNAQLRGIAGGTPAHEFALASAQSTENYDRLVGATNMSTFTPLVRAQLLSSRGDAEAALDLYLANLDKSAVEGLGRLKCWYLADMAWCYLRQGNFDRANGLAREAIDSVAGTTHVDDLAAAHTRLTEVFHQCGDPELAEESRARAREEWNKFSALQGEVVNTFSALDAGYLSVAGSTR